jgi:hypothetical protein
MADPVNASPLPPEGYVPSGIRNCTWCRGPSDRWRVVYAPEGLVEQQGCERHVFDQPSNYERVPKSPWASFKAPAVLTVHDLMANVTEAVFRAEHALDKAIVEYWALVKAEQAIVDAQDTSDSDKAIAARGVEMASKTLEDLKRCRDGA